MAIGGNTALDPSRLSANFVREGSDRVQGRPILAAEGRVLHPRRLLRAQRAWPTPCRRCSVSQAADNWVNDRPFKKLPGSRRSVFAALDQPALRPLPANAYEFATWRRAKVNIDYHIEVRADRHYYSVPYRLVGETVEVRISQRSIEIFSNHRRVASHVRRYTPGFSTDPTHMPESHRRHAEWTPGRIVAWAERTGPAVAKLAAEILAERPHPEQGYRTCLGIIRLGDRYGPERLDAACARALAIRAHSYRSVESILRNGLDTKPLPAEGPGLRHPDHGNVRGPDYYR